MSDEKYQIVKGSIDQLEQRIEEYNKTLEETEYGQSLIGMHEEYEAFIIDFTNKAYHIGRQSKYIEDNFSILSDEDINKFNKILQKLP